MRRDVLARRALTAATFLVALVIVLALILGLVAAGTWLFSEVILRMFPLDYGRIDSDP